MVPRRYAIWPAAAALLVLAALASCTAPAYDGIADQMVSDTQKQADDGLLKLESLGTTIETLRQSTGADDKKALADATAQAGYAANRDFYDKLQSSVTTLEARMTAMPDLSTAKLTDALAKLTGNVAAVRALHAKQTVLSAAYVRSARQILDQQFKALTVYELTIKSGNKPQ